jgi:uncharacterized membrane protein HdeD (DUF308 family)
METTRERTRVDWWMLIMGILLTVVAFIALGDPAGDLVGIVFVLAVLAVLRGVFLIVTRNRVKAVTGYKSKLPIVMGVVDIVVGVLLFCNIPIGMAAMPYIFAIWFIVTSVMSLFTLDFVSGAYFWFALVVDVLCVVAGFVLLVNPVSSVLTLAFLVGLFLMMQAVRCFVNAFN